MIKYISAWAANIIASAGMHILCIALIYNKTSLKITVFILTRALVLFLGFCILNNEIIMDEFQIM